MIGFGFARITNDEVAAKRGHWLTVADVVDAAQETLTIAPATHATQQRLAHVLQRQIEIRHACFADGIDEVVTEIARVQIQQAHPIGDCSNGLDQRNNGACAKLVGTVFAVAGEVLSNEHNLARFELLDLAQN